MTESSTAINGASSSSCFAPISFNNALTIRLDNTNFLVWRKQVLSTIRGYKLLDFITGAKDPPLKFVDKAHEDQGVVNQEFIDWEQQDQLLLAWLLSSMTEGVLTRVVNCETSSQVWSTLSVCFSSQIRAKISRYRTELKSLKKNDLTMNEFLLKIRRIVDLLTLVGEKISVKEHVEAIFDGLVEDYNGFQMVFDMRLSNDVVTVEEVEALLLSQEVRLEKKNKSLDVSQSLISANFAGVQQSTKRPTPNQNNGSGSLLEIYAYVEACI